MINGEIVTAKTLDQILLNITPPTSVMFYRTVYLILWTIPESYEMLLFYHLDYVSCSKSSSQFSWCWKTQ